MFSQYLLRNVGLGLLLVHLQNENGRILSLKKLSSMKWNCDVELVKSLRVNHAETRIYCVISTTIITKMAIQGILRWILHTSFVALRLQSYASSGADVCNDSSKVAIFFKIANLIFFMRCQFTRLSSPFQRTFWRTLMIERLKQKRSCQVFRMSTVLSSAELDSEKHAVMSRQLKTHI